jgi:hypothetical protein
MTPCSLVGIYKTVTPYSTVGSYNTFAVKTKAAGLSETLVTNYQLIKSQIPQDNNIHVPHHQIKSWLK